MIFQLKVACKDTASLRKALGLLVRSRLENNCTLDEGGAVIDYDFAEGDDVFHPSDQIVPSSEIRAMEDCVFSPEDE